MGRFSGYKGNVRFWLRGYLFLGVALLSLAMLVYSNHLIGKMREEAEATSKLFSRYIGSVIFEVNDKGSVAGLHKVVRESKLPIIVTVLEGRPILWHHVPVEERTDEDFDLVLAMDVKNPPTEKLRRLVALYHEFDQVNQPMPVRVVGTAEPVGWVHYGPSALQRELRYMPFVLLGIFLVFMGVAIQGLRYLKLSEQRSIWVGMAKETAHQLGTPISALLGWTQLIRDKARAGGHADIERSAQEMEVDLERLGKITERFSKIGSQPELRPVDLARVARRTVDYFHRRLPQLKRETSIAADVPDELRVHGNEELLEWVLENLVKNALDAIGESGGRVEIRARAAAPAHVDVWVSDTGRGIPMGLRERVFHPGFTTKRRGWGVGLALTRRIVEDYHAGTIRLVESRPGRGTIFLVRLPVA
ncbi:MAG: HAMP domain-containing histidine kinase [Candidatus Krumholzibacteria bacterium]|nr:HAMP domain-containing histidine kinase [Candidatus Krumholzibacteria bacterium]